MKKTYALGLSLLILGLVLILGFQNAPQEQRSAAARQSPGQTSATAVVPVVKTPDQTEKASREPLANKDVRVDGKAARALTEERQQALEAFEKNRAGVSVSFDPVTQSPRWIGSATALLTEAPPPLAAGQADAPIREFMNQNRSLFGHGAEVLDQARRVTDYNTARSPSRKVVWHQQLDGLDVFEAIVQANLTRESALINISSQMMPQPEAAMDAGRRAALLAEPPVSVAQAVAAAGSDVGENIAAEAVRPMAAPAAQPDRRQSFRAAMLTDADAKLIWVPMNEREIRLAWDVTLTSRSRAEMYRVLVDAENQQVLVRQALTAYISPATYRVYTKESPTPFSPGHETPSSLQPKEISRELITLDALDTTASPNGWINDGDNITSGNNTDTYTDADNNNSPDLPRTTGSPDRVFDFPMSLTQEPSTYKDASNTQLFYWTNFMHDRLYQLGFTEAAGNFQINNFGRGGVGNDPVNAEAQDGSGVNNANFSTPVDGGRGRMQMYLWTSPQPDRDGSFEAEVVLHEYAHGLSNRLVGGPSVSISNLSTRGMGEGWSDFYGLALTAEASDNPHGNWARAGYSRYLSSNWLSENYYYGARRYSYSTDMLKNPHTLRDIDPTQVDWHTSVPRNPTYGATQDATQVHYQGTVWCVTLWDLRANLILKHGFEIGNERALFLVTEGMKLGPANPNFIESRDGIVQATLVNHAGDLGEVWAAFAKRGMGHGATAPVSTTTTGIVESYAVPDSLEISDRSGWNIRGDKGGVFLPGSQTLTLRNDGSTSLNWSSNPGVPWLSLSPASGSLAAGATVTVTITTQATAVDSGFHSTSVVFTNTTSGLSQPVGVRLYVTPPVIQSFDLDSDPGWTTTGQWAFGTPTGAGGTGSGGSGNADPSSGATGSQVFGVNLSGNAASTNGGPFYLTTAPLDLSQRKNTRLRFMRWLNANALANARMTVEVSADGANWREVFVNPGTAITDNAWQTMEYDISSIADQQATVLVRWGYQNITSAGSYSGWNIDDVKLLGDNLAQFSLAFADSVVESGAATTGTLTLNFPQEEAVTATLTSSVTSAATVPASVTFPAGTTSQTFTLTPVDDALLDGTEITRITATAPNITTAEKDLRVHDSETATLTLTLPATAAEGSLGLNGSVSVSAAPDRPVTVTLSSSLPGLSLPETVTLPAGSTAPVSFTFSVLDNAFAEGSKNMVVTASVSGWTAGQANLQVTDDESPQIQITGPVSGREGDATLSFTATVNTLHTSPLVISLTSNDETELTVPATVEIPAGQLSAPFTVSVINDTLQDGPQSVSIAGSLAGYQSGSRAVTVLDNEVASYAFTTIPSPQKRNTPFAIAVTARDVSGATITNHSGSVNLTSSSAAGAVPFSPAVMTVFNEGVATTNITVTSTATAMSLTASDGVSSGTSNAFDVVPVQHQSFAFVTPTSASNNTHFPVTVTAVDDQGTTFADYNQATEIDMLSGFFDRTVGSTSSPINTAKIYNTAAHDSRVQLIYTAAEVGATPKLLTYFFLSSVTSSGQAMTNFKVRLKHTALENFDGQSWEESGWMEVYSASSFTGTSIFLGPFTKPFEYDGVRNLMIDISFDNSSASTAGTVRHMTASSNRMLSGTSNSLHGSPLTWTAATGPAPVISNELPVISFYDARSTGKISGSPVTFNNGVWSGQVFIPPAVTWLRATAASGISGLSNFISATGVTVNTGSSVVFSDGFETGTLGASWSTAANSGATARTQVTTDNTPKTGSYHLTMDTTSTTTGTFASNRPTLTLNLAGRKNVSLEWFAKSLGDDSHSPTLTGPFGTFDSSMTYDGVAISPDGITWAEIRSLRFLSSSYGTSVTRVMLDPIIQRLGWSYTSSFRMRFSQYDDQSIPNDGLAIDDVTVIANPTASIGVSIPSNVIEGTMDIPVTVSIPVASASNTLVTLTSNGPARLAITSSVLIAAGHTSAQVIANAPQNSLADAGAGVVITASAPGQTTSYHNVRVEDDEQIIVTVTPPASVTEGGASGIGTVSIEPVQLAPVNVFLSSSRNAEATVTSMVTLSTGSRSATFNVSPVNDVRLDGTQSVTITASGQGLAPQSTAMDVLDNETNLLTLTPPGLLTEAGTAGVGTVAISGTRTVDTTILLTSSDETEATVTASALIPAGQTSANFQVFPVDDALQDGEQSATLTASSAGFITATSSVAVADNDPAYFEWSIVPSPQTRNVPFSVTLTARDGTDSVLPGFNGTVNLSALGAGGPVALLPAVSGSFSNGVWTGSVTLGAVADSVTLRATGNDGATGISEAFNVISGGSAVGLAFAPISSSQTAGVPFAVEVFAVDAAGVLVNEVNGAVTVQLQTAPGGVTVRTTELVLSDGSARTTMVIPASHAGLRFQATAGSLTGQSSVFAVGNPELIAYPQPEVIFEEDFEAGTLQSAWTITGTGLHRTQVTGANGPRGSYHLTMDASTNSNFSRNEATLTLNLEGKTDVELSFWMKESGDEDHSPTSNPFNNGSDFDGVAISADGLTWHEVKGLRTADGISSVYQQFKINLSTAAANVGLSLNAAFKIRFNHYDDFTYGSDGFAFDDIVVRANAFLPPEPVVTLFADDFETGIIDPRWQITGTNTHRTRITSEQSPRGQFHLMMDVHQTADSRNEATLTLDTSGYRDAVLKFWMKENFDEDQSPPTNPFTNGADFDGVAISTNGTTWYEIQPLRGTQSTNNYQEFTLDLDAYMELYGLVHGPGLKIRFNHFDNSSWINGDGFAFDDIAITARPVQQLTLTAPEMVMEGNSIQAQVSLPSQRSSDTVVSLVSNRPGKITLPASVTIPAGSVISTPFIVAATQDELLTGDQPFQIVATAEGYRRSSAEIRLADDEVPGGFDLALTGPLNEGGSINGSVSLSTTSIFALEVALAAEPGQGLVLPAHVTIPAGGSSASFTLGKPNNTMILEPTSTVVTARLADTSDSSTIALSDNDTAVPITLSVPSSLSENSGVQNGSVSLSASATAGVDIIVSLTSSSPQQLSVPATVTIPIGSNRAFFEITPINDTLTDGTANITLTAAASGLTGDSEAIVVLDDDVHHFTIVTPAAQQIIGQTITSTVTAEDVNNQPIVGYNGTPSFRVINGAGSAVSQNAVFISSFTSGVANASVVVLEKVPAARLEVQDAVMGVTSTSGVFAVSTGPHTRFVWSAVGNPVSVGVPFNATLTARDDFGNTITDFNDSTDLALISETSIGTVGSSWTTPLSTLNHDVRSQILYTPAEVGRTGQITSLSLNITAVPGADWRNFTLRLKQVAKTAYTSAAVDSWEQTGWTTCFQGTQRITQTGWVRFVFSTPFTYDGLSSLMVDLSFDNETAAATSGGVLASSASGSPLRTITGFSNSTNGSPLTWSGTTPTMNFNSLRPHLQLGFPDGNTVTPGTTAAFTAGVWTGPVTVETIGTGMHLLARRGSAVGISTSFNASLPPLEATLSFEDTALESAGTITGTLRLNRTSSSSYTVLLSSSSSSISIASSVTLPANTLSIPINAIVSDDILTNGGRNVTITANVVGLNSSSRQIRVIDDDLSHFILSDVAPTQVRGQPFAVTITAASLFGEPIPNYTGTVTLSGFVPSQTTSFIPVQNLSNFQSGIVRTQVSVNSAIASMYLSVSAGDKVATGNNFAVLGAGPAMRLVWGSLPTLVLAETPQTAAFSFRDAGGNFTTNFSGPVALSVESVRQRLNDTGIVSTYPLETEKRLMRSQQIVRAEQLGGSGNLNSLSLLIKQVGPETTLDQFTIRLKHSSAAEFQGVSSWDNAGFTTVYEADPVIRGTGLLSFVFSTPFAYNGTDHLLVEFSYRDSSTAGFAGPRFASSAVVEGSGSLRYQAVATASEPDPLAWNDSNSSPALVDQHPLLEFGFAADITVSPSPLMIDASSWSGSLTLTGAGQQVRLRATSPDLTSGGVSDTFILIRSPRFDAEPAFTGGLENTLTWAAVAPGPGIQYEVQRALTATFAGSTSTQTTGTSSVQTGLQHGVTYFYRFRAIGTGWTTAWSPVVSSTQDNERPILAADENSTSGSVGMLSGTLSDLAGIGRLHLADTDIEVDEEGRWFHRVSGLSYGLNTFTLTFEDAAVPPNTHTAQVSLVRLMDDTYTDPTFLRTPESRWAVLGQAVRFAPIVLGTRPLLYAWEKNDTRIATATGPELVLPATKATDAARYSFRATSTKTGEIAEADFLLLLHSALPKQITAKVGSTLKLSTTTTVPKGQPAPTFQWSRPGHSSPVLADGPLSSGARVSGSRSATLNVSALTLAESGIWRLRLTWGTAVTEQDVEVQVLNQVPQIVSWPQSLIVYVSEFIDIVPRALNSPTSFSATGLPAGLSLDSRTGRITGRISTASKVDSKTGNLVPSRITLTARNAVGNSLPAPISIIVYDHFIPLAGTYQGLVDRDPRTNFDMGGLLSMTVAKTGVASGSISLAGERYSFKQPLNPLQVSDEGAGVYSAEATFQIARKKPAGLAPLTIHLKLNATGGEGYVDDLTVPTVTLRQLYGTGEAGAADDSISGVTAAQFNAPQGIAQNGDGQLYVADSGNHLIRRLTPSQYLPYATQTEAGTAAVAGSLDNPAAFASPAALVVGAGNVLFVADTGNSTIRRISAGTVTTLAGLAGQRASTDGLGSAARFDTPAGICVDPAGNLYVTDRESHVIRRISPTGQVTTLAGRAYAAGNVNGAGARARFQNPEGIVYDPVQKALLVLDAGRQIRRVTLSGAVTTWLTDLPAAQALAVDPLGHVFVATGASTLSPEGEIWHVSPAKIRRPLGITGLDMRGLIYVPQTQSLIVAHRDQHGLSEHALTWPDMPREDATIQLRRTPPAPADVPLGLYNIALSDGETGHGFLHCNHKATSTVITGRMPDGETFTLSTALGVDGQLYLHQMHASKKGSLQGSLFMEAETVATVIPFSWLKNDPASRSYPQVIRTPLTANGSRYTPGNLHSYLDLSASPASLRIMAGDPEATLLLDQGFTLTAPNTFTLPTPLKLSLNASTGILTGSFQLANPTRTANFSGVFIKGIQGALGHALIPDTAAKTSALSSQPLVIEIDEE